MTNQSLRNLRETLLSLSESGEQGLHQKRCPSWVIRLAAPSPQQSSAGAHFDNGVSLNRDFKRNIFHVQMQAHELCWLRAPGPAASLHLLLCTGPVLVMMSSIAAPGPEHCHSVERSISHLLHGLRSAPPALVISKRGWELIRNETEGPMVLATCCSRSVCDWDVLRSVADTPGRLRKTSSCIAKACVLVHADQSCCQLHQTTESLWLPPFKWITGDGLLDR